jgi:hypothetical protein
LFREENEWSINFIPNIKNFIRKAEKYQILKKPLAAKESFYMLGKNRIEHLISESRRLTAIYHNKQVDINRKILGSSFNRCSLFFRETRIGIPRTFFFIYFSY